MECLKNFYTTIYAQVFSPCGKYLVTANNYGKIHVFNLSPFILNDEEFKIEESHTFPIYQFQAHKGPIFSMVSNETHIFCGSVAEISAWRWEDVKSKDAKLLWMLRLPQRESIRATEVNALALGTKDCSSVIYAGCGDNLVYSWDLETRQIKSQLEGHQDYIHCLCISLSGQECISGSEDGSVRIWDTRKGGEAAHIVEPHKHESLQRPRFGKWIGCVAVDTSDDWLVCGGGPTLCLWHLRSLSPAVPLVNQSSSTVAHFHDHLVISGGLSPFVYHWDFGGDIKAEVPTTANSVYSIAISAKTNPKVLGMAGTSHKVDICTNFMYRDFSLVCC